MVNGAAAVDLYWLPLGAGGHFVKYNGRVYEWIKARVERRARCELYHSALQVELPEARYVIEQTPEPDLSGADRGVVAEGPVGHRWAAPFRLFRLSPDCRSHLFQATAARPVKPQRRRGRTSARHVLAVVRMCRVSGVAISSGRKAKELRRRWH